METYGLIIRHLRELEGLSLQATAKKIGRSTGWLSEIENATGESRITEIEFDRIVEALDGNKHRRMFMTWAATWKHRLRSNRTFDGAVLKFIRVKQGMNLDRAGKKTGLSTAVLSKLETGLLPVTWELRERIMKGYGYSPSSFKNLSSDPVRSKAVPIDFKLSILLNVLPQQQIERVFQFSLECLQTTETK